MNVSELMTTDVVTVQVDDSMWDATDLMLRHSAGSAIVYDGEAPEGIVTRTDALRAAYLSKTALGDIDVSREMSSPLVTTTATTSVADAVDEMAANDVKRLPIEEDLDVVGIVTTTDIARAQPEILAASAVGED
ncbi:CBS domain-containing protein [Halorubellus sp. PRR65]|uniref:CBS domain-containing protein n=1 Tax=Halorubellus sp. PRR65 TaxID=3098148 RepID=UPI002B25EB8A|nr:CBS domain-containing protein [Halorubellus sp. PRR65]